MADRAVLVVIPTYRPTESLVTLVEALRDSAVIVVSDDASPVTSDGTLRCAALAGASVLRHARNAGIARSLNAGLRIAADQGASWLLTVDQDTRVPPGYVATMLELAEWASGVARIGAVGAAEVIDASGPIRYPVRDQAGLQVTDELIQAGTLWSTGALRSIGGFDESFGIDAVDAAACVRLRRAGYSLALAPGSRIEHALGQSRRVRLLGRSVLATGHSPERRASMVRNRLRLLPEELAVSPAQAARSARRLAVNTALAVTVEEDRWAKARGSIRGLLPRRGK